MTEPDSRLGKIGMIEQVHGLDGVVRLSAAVEMEEKLREGELLYLKNRRGDFIPVRIEQVRLEEKHKRCLFFVKFDRIANRTEAEPFLNSGIYSDQPGSSSVTAEVGIEGYRVFDGTGQIGTVSSVMKNPAHPILQIRTSSGGELLIPWVDIYVRSVDPENRTVQCGDIEILRNL
ncbi:MAG: hypothetical protein WDZ33_00765 [Balneolaceae bacterium]